MRILITLLLGIMGFSAFASSNQDSVVISASIKYQHPSLFRQIFLGKNYRSTWSLPVKMPVFNIEDPERGFTILELGGGQQTKSLKLIDKDSVEWVLRTVDKDVEKAVPQLLRNTIAERVVQDMVSGAHPYAPLVIAEMAKKLRINAPEPILYYVPDDPAFGEHQYIFAHAVCMLERAEPTKGNTHAHSTEVLLENLKKENRLGIDDTTLLKARLLDMIAGDWDRHQDQWKWGNTDSFYYPIPRDRDQAFFYSNGLLVNMIRLFTLKHMVGFRKDNRKIKYLNRKSWGFDNRLLNDLDENEWLKTITAFQQRINDSILLTAVKKLPPEVYNKDGKLIYDVLKARRDALSTDAMKYYFFLSKDVTVSGSNEEEIFKLTNIGKDLQVSVYNKSNGNLIYQRVFNDNTTKKLRLNLMDGNDELQVDNGTISSIRILLNAGHGNDKIETAHGLKIRANHDTKQEM